MVPLVFHWEQLPALPFSGGKCLHPVPFQRILFPLPTPPSSQIPEIWDPIHRQSRIPAFLPSPLLFRCPENPPWNSRVDIPSGISRSLWILRIWGDPHSHPSGSPSRFLGFGIFQLPGRSSLPTLQIPRIWEDLDPRDLGLSGSREFRRILPPSPQFDHPLPAGFGISLWMQERDHPSLHRSQIFTPHS